MSSKLIAAKENLPERTVARIFSGDTENPGVDTIRRIIHALGGSWAEIFAETGAVIGGADMATMQAEVNKLTEEKALLMSSLNIANLELAAQKDKISALEAENKILSLKLEYDDRIIAIHNYYIRKANEQEKPRNQ